MRGDGLLAAYRRTAYEAGGAVARVGARSAALDALLRRRGARRGGFVTAWNPYSHHMPRGWNERMQARLRQAAGRLAPLAEGWGRGRGWAEHTLLLPGDPRRLAVLARRFRQNAILLVRRGGPARLLWCGPVRRGQPVAPGEASGGRPVSSPCRGWRGPARTLPGLRHFGA